MLEVIVTFLMYYGLIALALGTFIVAKSIFSKDLTLLLPEVVVFYIPISVLGALSYTALTYQQVFLAGFFAGPVLIHLLFLAYIEISSLYDSWRFNRQIGKLKNGNHLSPND